MRGELLIPEAGRDDAGEGRERHIAIRTKLNGIFLNYATAQLLTKGGDEENVYYLFFAPPGMEPSTPSEIRRGLRSIAGRDTRSQRRTTGFSFKLNPPSLLKSLLINRMAAP